MATEVALEQEAEEDWKLNNRRIAIFARMLERIAENHEVGGFTSDEPGKMAVISFAIHGKEQSDRVFMRVLLRPLDDAGSKIMEFFALSSGQGAGRNSYPVSSPEEVTDELLARMIREERDLIRRSNWSR